MAKKTPKSEKLEFNPNMKVVQSGTNFSSGYLREDYLATANGATWMAVIDKMRRQDSEIARVLRTIFFPILAASYEYHPSDDMDQEQVRQCTYKNKFWKKRIGTLTSGGFCSQTWRTMLRQFLNYLTFGYAIFEPVYYAVEDPELGNVITMRSLGMIHQATVERWEIKDGQVLKIYQKVPSGAGTSGWFDTKNMVILTNEQEGDNVEGISLIRPVYGNYIRKDLLHKLLIIGAEKTAVGTPIAFVPNNWITSANSSELTALRSIMRNYTSHEDAYLILPNSLKDEGFRIESTSFNASELLNCIKNENIAIMDSVLASFLNIGISKAGGNSQNTGQMTLFLSSLQSIAEEVTWVRDELAHQAYVLNFGEPQIRIDTTISGITLDSAEKAVNELRALATGALIEPDEVLEKWIRNKWKLPPKDPETSRKTFSDPQSMAVDKSVSNDFPTPDNEREEQANPEEMGDEDV
jgi:hypothetical protein